MFLEQIALDQLGGSILQNKRPSEMEIAPTHKRLIMAYIDYAMSTIHKLSRYSIMTAWVIRISEI